MRADPNPSDGLASYILAIAAQRERGVREGWPGYEPCSDIERKWRAEGPRPMAELDVVRGPHG